MEVVQWGAQRDHWGSRQTRYLWNINVRPSSKHHSSICTICWADAAPAPSANKSKAAICDYWITHGPKRHRHHGCASCENRINNIENDGHSPKSLLLGSIFLKKIKTGCGRVVVFFVIFQTDRLWEVASTSSGRPLVDGVGSGGVQNRSGARNRGCLSGVECKSESNGSAWKLDSRYEATKESTGRLKLIHWRFNLGVGISGCYFVSVRFSPTSKIYYMQGGQPSPSH